MMRERDLLVKQVFPELRRICAKRFVTFTEVDLRWGITEEQAAEGQVLPLCLAEIHRCRPYFLGLLGERYGWVPDSIPAEVIEEEPWLDEHLHGRTSVTELEILHGVLKNPAMQSHSFFYFRDPKWVESLPEAERREMTERDIPYDIEQYGDEGAARRTEERRNKLAALKDRIRKSGLPLVQDYASPEDLANTIRDQFKELIDRLYPEEDVPEVLDRERLSQEAYAKNRLFGCIERPEHLAALSHFVDSERDGKGLVITGESGGGKSVLLAAWSRDRAQSHPGGFLFQHYFGSTPESASVDGFLRRLLSDLKRSFDIDEEIPVEADKLHAALSLWLAQTTGRGQIILVLDGLNQIQGDEPDRRLAWLPRFFQPHVTVLASSLHGPALDTLQKRGWHEHDLPPASDEEIEAMVDAYLNEYRRTLESKLKMDLVSAPGSRNPLFLRTVLEELRQFGSFEKLPDRVAHYLEANNPRELFQRVLRRWQEDFDAGRDLTRSTVCHLWAARMGLSESEWLGLLGEGGEPLPRAVWTPLFLAMETHLAQSAGLYTFGHDFLRQAVTAEFLQADSDKRAAHLLLADYFASEPEMTPRKSDEWPWQLQEAEEWDRLQQALTDRELFLALFEHRTDVALGRYWVRLREVRPRIQIGKLYLEIYPSWEAEEQQESGVGFLANDLGVFLSASACYEEAEPLQRRALEIDEQSYGPYHPNIAASLNNLAVLLQETNRLSEAEPLFRRALEIKERSYGPDHHEVALVLRNLAMLLKKADRLSEAEPLYRRALKIYEQSYGPDHPEVALSLNNLAVLLRTANRLSEAEPFYRKALENYERSLGPDHPEVATSLNNLSSLLWAANRRSEAEPLLRRALEIQEQCLGLDHPQIAVVLNNLAELLRSTNRRSEAEPLNRRALAINEESYGPNHPEVARSLHNMAQLLKDTNRIHEAETLYRRALEIYEQSYGPDRLEVANALNNLATLLYSTDRMPEAEQLIRRALEIYEKAYGPDRPEVAPSLVNLAILLRTTNRLTEAEPPMRRHLEIFVKLSRASGHPHSNLQSAVNRYAELLLAMGRSHAEISADLHSLAPDLFDTSA